MEKNENIEQYLLERVLMFFEPGKPDSFDYEYTTEELQQLIGSTLVLSRNVLSKTLLENGFDLVRRADGQFCWLMKVRR